MFFTLVPICASVVGVGSIVSFCTHFCALNLRYLLFTMGKGGQGKGNWYNNNNSWGWGSSWQAPRPFPYAQYGAPAYNSQMGSVANNLDAALNEVCSLGKLVQVGSALNAAGLQQNGGNGASPSMTQALTTPAAPAASSDKDVATKLMEKFDKVAEHFTKPTSPPVADSSGARSSHEDERINALIENHATIKSMRREVSDVGDLEGGTVIRVSGDQNYVGLVG